VNGGAVAYLTESKYGRNGTEVTINNSSGMYTGRAGTLASLGTTSAGTYEYNTAGGVLASTTGNITGIYDMNGGVWEYITGYITNSAGSLHRSVFGGNVVSGTETESTKYRTAYPYDDGTSDSQATNYETAKAIYGDGVYETSMAGNSSSGSWHDDCSGFMTSLSSFFQRGGNCNYGYYAGMFAFGGHNGNYSSDDYGFRVVLALD
jgi:formylglycine-generating enzyme required for sulfatase activity